MLFQSVDQNEWNEAKNSYKKAIETIANKKKTAEGTKRLIDLDNWLTSQSFSFSKLPSKSEIKKIVEWKLSKGTFRPALLKNVESNSEDLIASSFTESLKLLTEGNCLGALKTFSKNLKGVGPATASLIFSLIDPQFCFMSMLQVFGDSKKLEYTFKSYESFYNLINEKKDSLKENNIDFTNQEIEQSLFADKILNLCGSKKRKHDVSEDTGIVVENNQKKKKGK